MDFGLPTLDPPRLDHSTRNGFLFVAALVAGGHSMRIPLWLILIVAVLFVWHYLITHHWRLPGKITRLGITLVLTLVTLKYYGTLFGRDAGMGFLVLLLGLKFLEFRTTRDGAVIIFLCYFLMLGGFLFDQSLWVSVYMVIVAWLATTVLIQMVAPSGQSNRYRLKLSGQLLISALPLALLLFLFFPRIQGNLWGLPSDAYSGLTGLSDSMSPGSISNLSSSDEVAFRVEFEGQPPPPKQRYWRAIVLSKTDGKTWSQADRGGPVEHKFRPMGTPVFYTITLEPHNKRWLFALDLPASQPKGAQLVPGYVLRAKDNVVQRYRYSLQSYPWYHTGKLSRKQRELNLELPKDFSPRVKNLVTAWRANNLNDQGIIRSALDYYRNQGFTYTLSPPLLRGDPVEQFLFESRRGYCEHYASSFVSLMRAAGIPSRVVTGYQGGERNDAGNYYIVTQADAHAWAEVWLQQRGWVRVDPTAVVAPERIEYGIDAVRRLLGRGTLLGQLDAPALLRALKLNIPAQVWRNMGLYWDAMNNVWHHWVLDFNQQRQLKLMQWLGFRNPTWTDLAVVLMSGFILFTLVVTTIILRRHQGTDPVVKIYNRFCKKLVRTNIRRLPWEGPQDFCNRAIIAQPGLGNDIQRVISQYIDIRYRGENDKTRINRFKKMVYNFRID